MATSSEWLDRSQLQGLIDTTNSYLETLTVNKPFHTVLFDANSLQIIHENLTSQTPLHLKIYGKSPSTEAPSIHAKDFEVILYALRNLRRYDIPNKISEGIIRTAELRDVFVFEGTQLSFDTFLSHLDGLSSLSLVDVKISPDASIASVGNHARIDVGDTEYSLQDISILSNSELSFKLALKWAIYSQLRSETTKLYLPNDSRLDASGTFEQTLDLFPPGFCDVLLSGNSGYRTLCVIFDLPQPSGLKVTNCSQENSGSRICLNMERSL